MKEPQPTRRPPPRPTDDRRRLDPGDGDDSGPALLFVIFMLLCLWSSAQ